MPLDTVLLALGPGDSDRLDALARTVTDVAGPAGADVVLAHVFTRDEFDEAASRLDYADAADATPEAVASRHSPVREVGQQLTDAGVEYEVASRIGDHGEGVVDIAEDAGVDLVVVGGRTRSPAGKAVFGSTAQQVMLESPVPVTFVRGD